MTTTAIESTEISVDHTPGDHLCARTVVVSIDRRGAADEHGVSIRLTREEVLQLAIHLRAARMTRPSEPATAVGTITVAEEASQC